MWLILVTVTVIHISVMLGRILSEICAAVVKVDDKVAAGCAAEK